MPNYVLVLLKFFVDVINELLEALLVLEDYPVDDGLVDLDGGELVLVALFNDAGHSRELFRDLGCFNLYKDKVLLA